MAQPWYCKAKVQAALAGGAFVILAAIFTPVIDRLLPSQDALDENEFAQAIWQ